MNINLLTFSEMLDGVAYGVLTRNEVRAQLGLIAIANGYTPFIMTPNGAVHVSHINSGFVQDDSKQEATN